MKKIPVVFHMDQLCHKPLFEWAFGEKIAHPETTSRAERILSEISRKPEIFELVSPRSFPLALIRQVADSSVIKVLKAASRLPPKKTFYPYVFPKNRSEEANPELIEHAGFFCLDSGTPLNATTWSAAAWSAACAAKAAQYVAERKTRLSYGLCRPPGHHASFHQFGGYCYFNNAAIAAKKLQILGKVAVLDIDFHHGNGTQELFYEDNQVLTVSLHGDPKMFFPYYSGFSSEKGRNKGKGYNVNIPLQKNINGTQYLNHLKKALKEISEFKPKYLVVAAGFDTFEGDPVGSFCLKTDDYESIGKMIAGLDLPTVVVQEGGYAAEKLGVNVVRFLLALRRLQRV